MSLCPQVIGVKETDRGPRIELSIKVSGHASLPFQTRSSLACQQASDSLMVVCCGCQTVDQRTGVDSDPDGLEIQAGGGGGGGGRGGGFVERKRIEIGDVVNTKCTKYVYIRYIYAPMSKATSSSSACPSMPAEDCPSYPVWWDCGGAGVVGVGTCRSSAGMRGRSTPSWTMRTSPGPQRYSTSSV